MQQAQMVAIEANYNQQMLLNGHYPYHLKKRIASQKGHLENTETAHTVASLIEGGCTKFAFCHMSEHNNLPMLLRDALDEAFGKSGIHRGDAQKLQVALRHEISPAIEF
ncbi:MBL fold metallo-hydrolase, partial [Ruminococcaceae bacterium OttesenSCG-928-N02]|nr:MBL fold metallo-hydrolase [Ruminococcaceae bacterium OttesenSCG-928-N02]